MKREEPSIEPPQANTNQWKVVLRNAAYILIALLTFLFALDLMISSLQQLGQTAAETIILATSNPFTGFFIGLLITAIVQSSSATTSMAVALTASGAINISNAVPIIMGANVGTTITSMIISLGFITKRKEFRRAVSAGAYHNFFNLLTAFILFPLEYYYGVLSNLSQYIATSFFHQPAGPMKGNFSVLGSINPVIDFLVTYINNGFLLLLLAFALLFGSILFFRKILSSLLGVGSPERFQQFFFKMPLKSFGWGLLTTAVIRSSTVTTSLVVPLVAKKFVKLKSAVPFILGANIGTTITAFIAASFNSNAAISIAIAHFLFNFIGVLIFFPIPYLRKIPINLANGLGKLTLRYRLVGFLYLLLTFFFIPFSLIYLNRNAVTVRELTYQRQDFISGKKTFYKVITKTYKNQPITSWMVYDSRAEVESGPTQIISVYRTRNLLFFNQELFELNKPGFCHDGEDKEGKHQICITKMIDQLPINPSLLVDSVYVFEKKYYSTAADSSSTFSYISASENLVVKKEKRDKNGKVIVLEELFGIKGN
ncbi:MAG TPA: Na/Pi symporter [Cyclobacteriaceae bacterium]|nr:Na/Pi symporter [Cyclobacteriaceae bacterium]